MKDAGLSWSDAVPELGDLSLGECLLTPTQIYVKAVRTVQQHYRVKQVLHGIAHITGGGLVENLSRILPPGVAPRIDWDAWPRPAVFSWLQQKGNVAEDEMARVFNLGIGMVFVVNPFFAATIQELVAEAGLTTWQIGEIVAA